MGEEDYAVRAAREWIAKSGAPIHMPCALRARDEVVQELAAIIRKHVNTGAHLDKFIEAPNRK